MRCHKTGVIINIALQHLFSWWETEIVPYFTAELLLLLVVLGKAIIIIPVYYYFETQSVKFKYAKFVL